MDDRSVAQRLTADQRRILIALDKAHKNGAIEVPYEDLGPVLGKVPSTVAQHIDELQKLGLLDRLEVANQACLSATGFRIARILQEATPLSETLPTAPQNGREPIPQGNDPELNFVMGLRSAVESFAGVVQESMLSQQDKSHLLELGRRFFAHPATFELLRRAYLKGMTSTPRP